VNFGRLRSSAKMMESLAKIVVVLDFLGIIALT
jgi:hypothetical protein